MGKRADCGPVPGRRRWSESSSVETGFSILRCSSEYGDYDVVGWVGPRTTSYLDATAPTNEVNWYKVREEGPGGPLYSDPVSMARPLVSVTALMSALSETPGDFGAFRFARDDWYPNYETAVRFTLGGEATAGVDYELIGPDGQVIENGVVTIPAKRDSVDVIVRAIEDNVSELNERIVLTLTAGAADGYRLGFWAEATLTIHETPDLIDIDSDNTNGFDDPDGTPQEDRIEDDATKPGKILAVNDNDDDGDGIPDFADGFDWDGITSEDDRAAFDDPNTPEHEPEEQFVPVILVLPEGVNPSVAKVKLTYSASDPANLSRSGEGTAEDPYVYAPGAGALRLWTKDGSAARDKASLASGGDFVPNNVELSWSALPEGPTANTKRLWLEAIAPSTNLGDQQITVSLDPDGPGPEGFVVSDALRVTIVQLELLRGDVDSISGRGAIGSANEVLHVIGPGEMLPTSDPTPQVVFDEATVSNVRENTFGALVANVSVAGYVTSAFADIVPENAADPTAAVIWIAGKPVRTVGLSREPEAPSILRPYAAMYRFEASVYGVDITNGATPIRVEVEDPATGNVGFTQMAATVVAAREPDDGADPWATLLWDRGLSQPLKVEVDLSAGDTLEDIAYAGASAVGVRAKRSFTASTDIIAERAGLELQLEAPPTVASGSVWIELLDTSNLGLSRDVRGWFTGSVTVSELYPDPVLVVFEETAPYSSIYVSRFYEATLTLAGEPSALVPDVATVEVRKVLWHTPVQLETATLIETGNDTLVFSSEGFIVSFAAMADLSGTVYDQVVLSVTNAALELTLFEIDVEETEPESLIFKTTSVFSTTTLDRGYVDYSEAWMDGPWTITAISEQVPSEPSTFVPLMVRINGPVALAQDPKLMVTIFGVEHPLVVVDGVIFSSGSGGPGVFTTTGNLKVGSSFGAGHISKTEGFVWAEFKGTKSRNANVYGVASTLFYETLMAIADERREARFNAKDLGEPGPGPGITYPDPQYPPADDPREAPAVLLFAYLEMARVNLGKASIDDDVRREALLLMTQHLTHADPAIDRRWNPIGVPNTPNSVYVNAIENRIGAIASKHLIGHWLGSFDSVGDGAVQGQNATQFLHLNTGLGWGDLSLVVGQLITIFDTRYPSKDDRARAIMEWLRSNGYLNALDPGTQARIARYGDAVAFKYGASKVDRWKEIVDAIRIARAFGGTRPDALSLFMAYDIASFEGFHLFGIDAFNDVIATEAGSLLAMDLKVPGIGITSPETLWKQLEWTMLVARSEFLDHPVFSDRNRTLRAFYTSQLAYDGRNFKPLEFVLRQEHYVVWYRTLGMIVQQNADRLKTFGGADGFHRDGRCNRQGSSRDVLQGPGQGGACRGRCRRASPHRRGAEPHWSASLSHAMKRRLESCIS